MSPLSCVWFDSIETWSDTHWMAWDGIVASSSYPSFHLDSRSLRSLFDSKNRNVWAVVWHEGSSDDPGNWRGVTLVEDTHAESHRLEQHLESRSWWFSVLSKRLHGASGAFRFPVRVVGSVLGSGGHAYRFSPTVPAGVRRELVSTEMVKSLRATPGEIQPKVVLVKDFPAATKTPRKRRGFKPKPWSSGWVDLEFDPVMRLVLNPEWKHMDDYLEELKTKARTKVKRILKCSEGCRLELLDYASMQANIELLHSLYLQVYAEASFRLGALSPEDLLAAKRHWGDDFKVQVVWHDDQLVAFQCGYLTSKTVEAFFVGFNRELNKDLSLYQRMLIEFIQWGIEAQKEEVAMGRTALDIKSSVGATPERWLCSVQFQNQILQWGTALASRQTAPSSVSLKQPWKSTAIPLKLDGVVKEDWV
jgi:hypothetical protein